MWGLGAEYSAIVSPIWRITIASIVAEVVSELVDTEMYHLWVTRVGTSHQWARVLVSNAVSVPLDNVIFVVGAFAALPFLGDHPLTLPWSEVWDIFVVNLTVKGAGDPGQRPADLSRPRPDGGPVTRSALTSFTRPPKLGTPW